MTADGPPAESFEQFLDQAPCGLLTTSADGTIVWANGTFLQWTGYSRAELVGARRFDELLTLPCRIYHETHYAPLLRMQGFAHEIATDLVSKSGRVLTAFLNSNEERDADGNVLRVRTAVFAGSDRRKYERELLLARRSSEQAARAKADFLAMFAHEVRNPLAAILIQVQLMERKGFLPEQEVAFGRLRSSVDKLLSLVNNMLEISKLEAGKVTLEQVPFGLRDVVQAVVHTFGAAAERKGLQLQVELDSRIPDRVRGDPVKLDQVLTNLVGNAVKFTERGTVTIGASCVACSSEVVHLRLWVRDTGIGIPLDRQAYVFEDYVQADPTVAARFGGTGLGLAISRKLLDLQGSRLELQSAPEEGSTFSFELRLPIVRG